MSIQKGQLIASILLEHFSETVKDVGLDLYRYGPRNIGYIVNSTSLAIKEVKDSLRLLGRFNLLNFKPGRLPNTAEYELKSEEVLLFIRYPKYIYIIKEKYGDDAENIIDELFNLGFTTASDLILRTHARNKNMDNQTDLATLRESVVNLVNGNYLIRCTPQLEEATPAEKDIQKNLKYSLPVLDIKELTDVQEGLLDKCKDSDIFWAPNFKRFDQDMRDELLVTGMINRIDNNAGEVMKSLLQQMYLRTDAWEATSNPIPFLELKQMCERTQLNKFPQMVTHLDQYLKIIEEDSCNFIQKVGDSAGGQYTITMKKALEQLAWSCIESYIVERFSSKSARIFRVIKTHNFIDQELIQRKAMIPDREAKQLTYELLSNNFIQHQIKKSGGSGNQGQTKNFFLFHISLPDVVLVLLDITYKALYNEMSRREQENQQNMRLLQKQSRVENIVNIMKKRGDPDEHIQDIEDTITPADHAVLAKVRKVMDELKFSELYLDDTLFLLQTYLYYQQPKK